MNIAAVQMDVKLGEVDRNLSVMLARLRESRERGAELTIFPECALTGYNFESLQEAVPHAQPIPGPATDAFTETLREVGGFAVVGMLEPSPNGVFNVAVLVGPEGVIGTYRKIHLPNLGADQFSTYGDRPFAVFDVGELRVGLAICYDSALPESARVLTLLGADLIVLPTNFPAGAENMTRHFINTRAMENSIYFAAVNRVGTERGVRFIGESIIADPAGNTLARADGYAEEILYAEIDPRRSRNKRVSRIPGKQALDRLADRRPEMYGLLVEPHDHPRPRDELN
jgi:5-aminopentanamidase